MANILLEYSSSTALTISLASLADSATAGRESTVVDNSSTKYHDALVMAKFKPQNSGSISSPAAASLWVYASIDGGTTYTDAATGSDSNITLNNPTQLRYLGAVYAAAINTTYIGGPFSVASCFGGRLPQRWGIVVVNDMGTALSATGSDHSVTWQGVYMSVA